MTSAQLSALAEDKKPKKEEKKAYQCLFKCGQLRLTFSMENTNHVSLDQAALKKKKCNAYEVNFDSYLATSGGSTYYYGNHWYTYGQPQQSFYQATATAYLTEQDKTEAKKGKATNGTMTASCKSPWDCIEAKSPIYLECHLQTVGKEKWTEVAVRNYSGSKNHGRAGSEDLDATIKQVEGGGGDSDQNAIGNGQKVH